MYARTGKENRRLGPGERQGQDIEEIEEGGGQGEKKG